MTEQTDLSEPGLRDAQAAGAAVGDPDTGYAQPGHHPVAASAVAAPARPAAAVGRRSPRGLLAVPGVLPGAPVRRASGPVTAVVPASDCGCGSAPGEPCSCGTGASGTQGYVYALGSVTARFPSLNIEKEFMQAWGKSATSTLAITDADKFAVLSQGQNLYLAREMCWVFQSADIDVYILQPQSYVELTDLVTCLSPTPGLVNYALVIGDLGPVAPPSLCNGAQLPVVTCTQVFSFTQQAFVNSIVSEIQSDQNLSNLIAQHPLAGPDGQPLSTADSITASANNAFAAVTLLADNTGQTDEHRAINYLAFKSLALYKKEVEMETSGFQLNSVLAQPDPLSQTRSIQDVILLYANNTTTQTQRFFTRVDVSGRFPFLLNDLAAFYDHP